MKKSAQLMSIVLFVITTAACWGLNGVICIDAGHGGSDIGAEYQGAQEKTNCLNTALRFHAWLDADSANLGGGGEWSVIKTRTGDFYISLLNRANLANNAGAERFISLHNNSSGVQQNGTETYCSPTAGAEALNLRNNVQAQMLSAWSLYNRGNKTSTNTVLTATCMPAVQCNLGYIDYTWGNNPDATYVNEPFTQDIAGRYLLYAVQTHYGITNYRPVLVQTITNDSPTGSSNWTVGTSAADKYGVDYKWRSTQAVSDPASWTINVPAAGAYDVCAWWSQGTNRAKAASYILPAANGSVSVNQQANGGKWNLLKKATFGAGTGTFQLSCWTTTGYIVVADAMRIVGPKLYY